MMFFLAWRASHAGWLSSFLMVAVCGSAFAVGETEQFCPETTAASILNNAGRQGGLIVHLGCGDGRLTAALGKEKGRLVQGLDSNPDKVRLAREHIASLGRYGRVSVRQLENQQLPYIDGLVNLLVVSDGAFIDEQEWLRVLSPGGVVVILDSESESPIAGRRIKPWPEEIDQWTHYLYNASGNAVSRDTHVGPPRRLQWQADPRWARSHEHTASITSLISGEGKIFYIEDQGMLGIIDPRLPERWALVARDAFSGVLLWKKDFSDWGNLVWGGTWHIREPMTIPRRLVVGGGRLYATLGFRQTAISVVDPDTGTVLDRFEEGKNNDELIWHDGLLIVRQRKEIPDYPIRGGSSAAIVVRARRGEVPDIPPASLGDETLVALDGHTGQKMWKHVEKRIVSLSLAAHQQRVVYHNFQEIVCLDLRSGRELWRAECPSWPDIIGTAGTLLLYGDKVVHAGDRGIQAFSAETGEPIWQGPRLWRMSVRHPPDLFIVNGLAWGGPTPPIAGGSSYANHHQTPTAVPRIEGEQLKAFDVTTGEVVQKLELDGLVTPGHHVRCYRSKATSRFLIWPKRGMEFIDLTEDAAHERTDWARGECGYGVMPSGGLLYVPPHPCICYLGVLLHGFNALAPNGSPNEDYPDGTETRPGLLRGPAYARQATAPTPPSATPESDWPTYRYCPARSGTTSSPVSIPLDQQWTLELGGHLTAPVVAGELVFVVSVDTHTLHAVEISSGEERWRFTADARIDSPPTIYQGLVLFGCTDGRVYCLQADHGDLAWRFHAAPRPDQCVVRDQLESLWPVHGSVLIQNGIAYFCAGRSSFLDGGLYLFALDPRTGELLHRGRMDGPWPNPQNDSSAPYFMEGAKSDVLVGDGEHLFMGFQEFDHKLNQLPGQPFAADGSRSVRLRLMATTGLLDDTWWDRGRWTFSTRWPGRNWSHNAPFTGQILSFDADTVYALNAFPTSGRMSPLFVPEDQGYLLTAQKRENRGEQEDDRVRWQRFIPIRSRAMVLAGNVLFLAGAPDHLPENDPYAALEGRWAAKLWAVSAHDGTKLYDLSLDAPPVFDGLIAAKQSLFLSTVEGALIRLATLE